MNKKWLLGLGGIAAIALPVSTVVACGDDTPEKPGDGAANQANTALKVGDKLSFKAKSLKEAQIEFNKIFKVYIEKAAKGFDANADKGKEATGSAKTDAITNPVALAPDYFTKKFNDKNIVKIFTKGNNTLFLLKDGTSTRPEKKDIEGNIQLTYPTNRSDDNDASKATAGLIADFGNKDQPKELHDAISNDKSVTSILGFYNYAQQEKNGGPYVQRVYGLTGLYDIKGQTGLVNASSDEESNIDDIKIEAKFNFTKALSIITDFKSTLNKAEMKTKFSGKAAKAKFDFNLEKMGLKTKDGTKKDKSFDFEGIFVKTPYDESTGKIVISVSLSHLKSGNEKNEIQISEPKDITITAKDA